MVQNGNCVSSPRNSIAVASSQPQETSSEPPRKRRRIQRIFEDSDEDESASQASEASVTLPSDEADDWIPVDDEALNNQRPKHETFMHEPVYADTQRTEFVTQVDQPWSSPTRIRGPRWRKKSATPSPSPEITPPNPAPIAIPASGANVMIADDFDDDEVEAFLADQGLSVPPEIQDVHNAVPTIPRQQSKTMRQSTLFGISSTTQTQPKDRANASQAHSWPLSNKNETPTHHKINEDAMQTWIFPTNVGSLRDYQYNIVHKALYNNILIALPTGLGKTFIAATVMRNWYDWTREAQVVFMAPTKPLVSQQIEACFNIAGIPRSQTTLMTGEIPPAIRAEEWQKKRVFFMTPQTMINDLKTGIADPKRIVLIVVDEAHKATGNYAYAEVVRFLRRFNDSFRIMGLTATPGSTVEAVQDVIDGLDIARVEIRTEDSLDIRPFVHQRNTELELFDFSEEQNMCIDLFAKAIKPTMDKLNSQNAWWSRDPTKITLFGLMQAQKKWSRSDAGRRANPAVKNMIFSCFKPLLSLAHNLELLKFHSIGSFYHKMKLFRDQDSGGGKSRKSILESEHFITLMSRLHAWINNDSFVGHPKLSYLNSVVLNHFMDAGNGAGRADGRPPSETRIMVFAHYRDSAEEICRILNRHAPMVRAHVFVGQSNTSGSDGMDQKTQNDVIKKFKAGTYNTLVATSIGEEGLDIGEVDLIVCFDCSKSPIRMLQRMGRTGRKRAGNIVMLLMKGTEENNYLQAKDNYAKMQEIIESGKRFLYHEDRSPRIVPKGITPVALKIRVEIPLENTQADAIESVEPRRSRSKKQLKRPPKKFHMPDNVETGFTFLGGKSKKKVNSPPEKNGKMAKKKRTFLDEWEASDPLYEEVILTAAQEEDLEDRYAQVAGDEPQEIQVVQLDKHPAKVRSADNTLLVDHSVATNRMLAACSSARESSQYAGRPYEPTDEDLATIYSGRAPVQQEPGYTPFYVSHQADAPVASQAEVLPELDNLFGTASSESKDSLKTKQIPKRGKKQVISDDEDD